MANMEHTNIDHNASEGQSKRKHRHEGPRNHLLTFALSILLTAFAFLAVVNFELEPWWVIVFIVTLAVFQAVIQLAFWMHMKDRGHFMPIVGIAFGVIIAFTCVASGIWMSWL